MTTKAIVLALPVPIILVIGVLLSFAAYEASFRWASQQREESFQLNAIPYEAAVTGGFKHVLDDIHAIQQLYGVSTEVSPDVFSDFVRPFLEGPPIVQAYEWVPRVADADRNAFEVAAQRQGLGPFAIKELAGEGNLRTALRRADYFPVFRVAPSAGNEQVLGFDLGSEPIRRKALEQARDVGQPAASAPIKLIQETDTQIGMLVFVPRYRTKIPPSTLADRRKELLGFALGAVRIGQLVEAALAQVPPHGFLLQIRDGEVSDNGGVLYTHFSRLGSNGQNIKPDWFEASPLIHKAILDIAGRRLELRIVPRPEAISLEVSRWPLTLLAFGLTITVALACLVRLSHRHRLDTFLKAELATLSVIFENSPIGIAITRLSDGRFIHVNQAFLDIQGYGREEIIGHSALGLDLWVDSEHRRRLMQNLKQGESVVQTVMQSRRKNGEIRTLLFSANKLLFQNEPCVIGSLIDITEQKRTETTLDHAQSMASLGGWTLDFGTGLFTASVQARKNLGWPSAMLGWADLLGIVHPSDRLGVEAAWQAALSGAPYDICHRIVVNGETRWLHAKAEIEYDQTGQAITAVGISQDITAAKQAELALLESEQRYLALLQDQTEIISRFTADGTLLFVNDAYCRLFGKPREALVGHKWHPAALSEDIPLINEKLASLSTSNPVVTIENRIISGTGEIRWAQFVNRAFFDDRGQLVEMQAVGRDITERVLSERSLAESEARFRCIFEKNRSVMGLVDPQTGALVSVNQAAADFYGYSIEALQAMTIDQINTLSREEVADLRRQAAEGNRSHFNFSHRLASGEVREVEVYSTPINMNGRSVLFSIVHDVDDRRQAELLLRESQLLLEQAQAVAHIGSWQLNHSPNLFNVSEETRRIFGLAASGKVAYEDWIARVHPEDQPQVEAAWLAALRGAPYEAVYRIVVQEQTKWIRALAELNFDGLGKLSGGFGTVQDITPLRLAQLEREQQEHLLQTILAHSPNGLALFDGAGHLISHNQRYVDLLTYPQELIASPAMSFYDLLRFAWERGDYPEITLKEILASAMKCFEDRQPGHLSLSSRDGKILEIQGIPLGNGWTLVSYNDITALKLAEAETSTAMRRLKLATEAADLGVWVWNFDDNSLEWDERMCAWYEASEADLRAGLYFDVWRSRLHPDDAGRAEAALRKARRNDSQWSDTFRLVLPSGIIRHIQAAAVLVLDVYGEPLRMVGINRDITAQYQLEEDLRTAMQRTDDANRAKSEFLANMSHEIRTPMNAILGLTGLVLETELTPRQRDYLVKIHKSSKALLRLLNDILDYSKIEARRLEIERRPFQLADVVCDLTDLFSIRFEQKGLAWRVEIDPSLPRVLVGDALRLEQVLINLVGNAVKFTELGGVTLCFGAMAETASATVLRVSVRDTGIGMSPEHLERVFAVFSQADNSTARKFGGTGLGLSISKRLVELMDGTIEVESTVGQGSVFTFTARFQRASDTALLQANAENLQAVQAEALAKQAAPIYGRRILLVDDDEPSLTLAAEWLSRIGLVVVLAASGEEAVELAVREQFDAVLMDLNMPRMHGYEAARHIQMKLGKNSPPIIALTAAAMEQHRQASLDAGMVDHLVKPIGPAGLLNALLHWIKPVEAAPARTLDDGELARLASSLLRLRRLLAGNEFAAIDAAEDIEALLEGTDLSKPFRPTCEAVRGLRSKDALAALTLFQKHVPPMPEIKS